MLEKAANRAKQHFVPILGIEVDTTEMASNVQKGIQKVSRNLSDIGSMLNFAQNSSEESSHSHTS